MKVILKAGSAVTKRLLIAAGSPMDGDFIYLNGN
jgi:hypothetical protein